MKPLSVSEISSILSTRNSFPKKSPSEHAPHKRWDACTRAAIVILWGLLIYPQLDPDLQQKDRKCTISISELQRLFWGYLGSQEQCMKILNLLNQHDYIRIGEDQSIESGTELFKAVDALKMYRIFRGSMLARTFYQQNQ